VYGELQSPIGRRAAIQTGVRFDEYSTFGRSWSPSISFSSWITNSLKIRGAAGHAFRIPTYTELYYHDPANLGTPDLRAEHGWSVDGGVDLQAHAWLISVSPFSRWDKDVIDWTRPTAADLWRSGNIRDVTTTGVELSAMRRWKDALIRASYTGQSVDAPALTALSKYVLEYARHSIGFSIAAPVGGSIQLAVNADRRVRLDGQRYTLVGLRLSRPLASHLRPFIDVSNLLDEQYHEIVGVDMPGRWVTVGAVVR
jgi:iron complex outermembrane receptor protein